MQEIERSASFCAGRRFVPVLLVGSRDENDE
jgi:hypothetical protein